MKKVLILMAVLLLVSNVSYAQNRGALTNVFASWISVTTSNISIALPVGIKSRDVWIHNGSAVDICVDPMGNSVGKSCNVGTAFQLDGASSVYFSDLVTEEIRFSSLTTTASPVSVVVTY